MNLMIIAIFVIGYTAIAFEHPTKINKTASALLTGVLCWVVYIMSSPDTAAVSEELYEPFGRDFRHPVFPVGRHDNSGTD